MRAPSVATTGVPGVPETPSPEPADMTIQFTLNGAKQSLDLDPTMPLLWALRDVLNLTGTKFGCGIGR